MQKISKIIILLLLPAAGITQQQILLSGSSGCPDISATISGDNTSYCNGDAYNFSVSISGGASPYTVTWNDGSGPQVENTYTSGSNISYIPTAHDTDITLTSVVDANGCTAGTLSGNVDVTHLVSVNTDEPHIVTCSGDNTTITATGSGGAAPYEYSWDGGGFTVLNQVSKTNGTNYTVQARDDNGCKSIALAYNVTIESPEMAVSGGGINITDGDNTPSITDLTQYGTIDPSAFKDVTFVVENTGAGSLTIPSSPSLSFSPAVTSFQVQSYPSNIPAGQTGNLVIRFNHTQALAENTYTATITITTNECVDNTFSFDIQGTTEVVPNLILDDISGADAAYSLRYLTNNYTGDVILAEKSGGMQEGFTPSEITDGTLTSWAGSGDAWVVIWYDQLGANDWEQINTVALYAPRIVINGTLVTSGGNPAIDFDGVNDYLQNGYSLEGRTEFSHWAILEFDDNNQEAWYCEWIDDASSLNDAALFIISSSSQFAPHLRVGTSFINGNAESAINTGQQYLINIFLDDSEDDYEFYLDGATTSVLNTAVSGSIQTSSSAPTLGRRAPNNTASIMDGRIFELVFFTIDKEPDLSIIQSNINSYYSIW